MAVPLRPVLPARCLPVTGSGMYGARATDGPLSCGTPAHFRRRARTGANRCKTHRGAQLAKIRLANYGVVTDRGQTEDIMIQTAVHCISLSVA